MDVVSSFDERNTQDIFIKGLDRSNDVFNIIKDEHEWVHCCCKQVFKKAIQAPPATVPRQYGNKPMNSKPYNTRSWSNYTRPTNSVSTELMFADVNGIVGDVLSATGNEDDLAMLCEAICAISSDLDRFDSKTKPCALFKKTGHTIDGCEQLQNLVLIRQHYILSSGGSYPSYPGGIQSMNTMNGAPIPHTFTVNQLIFARVPFQWCIWELLRSTSFRSAAAVFVYWKIDLQGVPMMMARRRAATRWLVVQIVLLKTITIFGRADPKAQQA